MQQAKEIVREKMEKIKASISQYEDGLITGAEALLHICVVSDDPVVSVIHQYDTDCRRLANKMDKDIEKIQG